MADSKRIIELARECLGTPFVHQGRVVGVGMDCAGVLVHIFRGLGCEYVDQKGYPVSPYKGMIEKAMELQPHLTNRPTSELRAGDVVLFRIKKDPQHIGIYTGDSIVHAYSVARKVIEVSLEPWRKNLTYVFRITP